MNRGNGFTIMEVNKAPLILHYKNLIHQINITEIENSINELEQYTTKLKEELINVNFDREMKELKESQICTKQRRLSNRTTFL